MAKEGLPPVGIKKVMKDWSDANERVLNYRKQEKQKKPATGKKK